MSIDLYYSSNIVCLCTQQNGIAEKKNRHLLKVAPTIMLHSHVSMCQNLFWLEVVLIIYLIDRMSSSAQENRIPLQILRPDISLFHASWIFGYTCFVGLLGLIWDKLSPRRKMYFSLISLHSERLHVLQSLQQKVAYWC